MDAFGLPQVYRDRSISFSIYFNEGNEPPHVHAHRGRGARMPAAKFWILPVATLCENHGFGPGDLRWIRETVDARRTFFLEEWHATQARKK
jgi:hypothetical protein